MIAHGDDTYNYDDIRLNFSSNVYSHFDHTRLFRYLSEQMSCVASYPEPAPTSLEQRLADCLHIDAQNLMVTNGATEAIYLIAQEFSDHVPVIPQPTFSEYEQASKLFNHHPSTTFNSQPSTFNLIWLCNPNNPTGAVLQKNDVKKLFSQYDVVVIDQSYEPYYDGRLFTAEEITQYDNVIMLRSMTKEYGIPGLRLGYVVGAEAVLRRLRRLRMPWSVNALAIQAGHYLLQHTDDYVVPTQLLCSERERVAHALNATGHIDALPSDTHMLLCRLHHGSASELKDTLARQHGILIRDASNFTGLDHRYFRIAVQHPEENDILIDSINTTIEQS